MAKPRRTQAETDDAPVETALQRRFAGAMSSVAAVKPEWQQLGDQIAALYRQEREATPVGRLSLLADASAIASILTSVDICLTPQQAANTLGHAPSTATTLIAAGTRDAEQGLQTAHAAFSIACQMAKDRRRMRILGGIEAAGMCGPQFWPALAWLGERTYGQDYKLQQVSGGGNVIVNVGVYAPTDVRIGGESVSSPVIDVRPAPVSD